MAWTERTKQSASWSTRNKPSGASELDFLFSDATDFLFSDSLDFVFVEAGTAASWSIRTKPSN